MIFVVPDSRQMDILLLWRKHHSSYVIVERETQER